MASMRARIGSTETLLLPALTVLYVILRPNLAAAQAVQPAPAASSSPDARMQQEPPLPVPGGTETDVKPPSGARSKTPSESDSKYRTQFTNTLKYSLGLRTLSPAARLIKPINLDDGDRNFSAGSPTFNRVDLISELDLENNNFGVRFSGEGWYDTVYRASNANNSPSTVNQTNTPYNQFVPETRNLMGEGARVLDAFAFGNFKVGKSHVALRAGRHAILWGQTLFFGANGIANGMAPLDLTKALSAPDLQFKELILPTAQLSTEIQLNSQITVGGFYQLEWQKDVFPPVGSYFSQVDLYDEGAQRLFAGPPPAPGAPPLTLGAGAAVLPRNNGEYGVELLFRPAHASIDFGLYALQYTEKVAPTDIVQFGAGVGVVPGQIGLFYPFFPQAIHTYGASASTNIGTINFATEVSWRNNAPLNADSPVCGTPRGLPPGVSLPCGNTSSLPIYPVGDTLHANANILYTVPALKLAPESSLALELAYNDLLKVSANRNLLSPNSTASAAAARFVYTPVYRQVHPGIDLSVPIGFGAGLFGKSASLIGGEMPAGGTGDFEVGLSAEIHTQYRALLRYTGYIGPSGPTSDPAGHASYQQRYADRNFISFGVSRSF